ncbi:MAG TPA: hypothetical protein VF116_20725 [Ktedonobacterales bacterium]
MSVSREELAVLLRLLKIGSLPGFDLSWLHLAPDGSVGRDELPALEAATNALVARGFLEVAPPKPGQTSQGVSLPAPLVGLIRACAASTITIRLALLTSHGDIPIYLHELEGVCVAHTVPQPDIHQFLLLSGRRGMLDALATFMGLDQQPSLALPPGLVIGQQFQPARDAALLGRVDAAAGMFAAAGLAAPTAGALAQSVATARTIGLCSIAVRAENGEVRRTDFAFIIAPGACFVISAVAADPGTLEVRPASATEVRAHIVSQLPRTA